MQRRYRGAARLPFQQAWPDFWWKRGKNPEARRVDMVVESCTPD